MPVATLRMCLILCVLNNVTLKILYLLFILKMIT